jgi:hypothetical protein
MFAMNGGFEYLIEASASHGESMELSHTLMLSVCVSEIMVFFAEIVPTEASLQAVQIALHEVCDSMDGFVQRDMRVIRSSIRYVPLP